MHCFPCAVAKRDVELRLADLGVPAAEIVARASATLCLMCAEAERQRPQRDD
ncbi:MAG: hypothetical protein ACR2KV_05935 [Solirubrobacteraceae bacterium]